MPSGFPLRNSSKVSVAKGDMDTNGQNPPRRSSKRIATAPKDASRQPKSDVGRQSTVVVRKRLPWLDGPQQSKPGRVPGYFDSKESLGDSDATDNPLAVPSEDRSPPTKASMSSLGKDPALRAVGSTPSLRKRARSGDFKSLSLNSQPRSGIKPVTSKQDAKRALGMVDEQQQGANYASSEYSANASSDRESIPPAPPKNDLSSYERLVQRQSTLSPNSREPFHVANQWPQSQLDLPLDNEVSPGQSPNDRSAREQYGGFQPHLPRSTDRHHRRDRCRSCDQELRPREPEQAKISRTRTIDVPPPQPPDPTPLPPPTRKSTLFAMPTHLLPSSSSSSHDNGPQESRMQRSPTTLLQTSPQPAVTRPQTTPTTDVHRQSQSLNRAVTGLEALMEEALNVARNAAQNGRNDEVANILNNATIALRKASLVNRQMDEGRMSHPLVLSPSVPERDSEVDSLGSGSDASSFRSATGNSVDTAPTLLTKSAQSSQQPLLDTQGKTGGRSSISQNRPIESEIVAGHRVSPERQSMSTTPPRLYQPPSVDSIVRDFAYARSKTARAEAARRLSKSYGAASDYYGDTGQSVSAQPGVRPSMSAPTVNDKPLPPLPPPANRPSAAPTKPDVVPPVCGRQSRPVRRVEPVPTLAIPPRKSSRSWEKLPDAEVHQRKHAPKHYRPHISDLFESPYYHQDSGRELLATKTEIQRESSQVTNARYDPNTEKRNSVSKHDTRYSGPPDLLQRNVSLRHPRRNHISLRDGQGFSLGRYHRRQPIAREWSTSRKRISATIACMNTVFIGLIAGIYVSQQMSCCVDEASDICRLVKFRGSNINWPILTTGSFWAT